MSEHQYFDATKLPNYAPLPIFLIEGEKQYCSLSCSAKVLYSLMLRRANLSKIKNWKNDQGNIFIKYSIRSAAKHLNCSKQKAINTFAELVNADLLEKTKHGLGRGNDYVLKIPRTSQKGKS